MTTLLDLPIYVMQLVNEFLDRAPVADFRAIPRLAATCRTMRDMGHQLAAEWASAPARLVGDLLRFNRPFYAAYAVRRLDAAAWPRDDDLAELLAAGGWKSMFIRHLVPTPIDWCALSAVGTSIAITPGVLATLSRRGMIAFVDRTPLDPLADFGIVRAHVSDLVHDFIGGSSEDTACMHYARRHGAALALDAPTTPETDGRWLEVLDDLIRRDMDSMYTACRRYQLEVILRYPPVRAALGRADLGGDVPSIFFDAVFGADGTPGVSTVVISEYFRILDEAGRASEIGPRLVIAAGIGPLFHANTAAILIGAARPTSRDAELHERMWADAGWTVALAEALVDAGAAVPLLEMVMARMTNDVQRLRDIDAQQVICVVTP